MMRTAQMERPIDKIRKAEGAMEELLAAAVTNEIANPQARRVPFHHSHVPSKHPYHHA
jgi:hypothetical protein